MNTVALEFEDGIAWVAMNRPDKKNAISVEMAREMAELMDRLETDERCDVLVLTGAGESFSAGMDLKDYFRATDNATAVERARVYRLNAAWQWRGLLHYPKPTIAMVNGWCFGGAFTPLAACHLAVRGDGGPDVADRYIADTAEAGDVAVTADIPLASILVEKRVWVTRDPDDAERIKSQTIPDEIVRRLSAAR